jgi:hypothetical protein
MTTMPVEWWVVKKWDNSRERLRPITRRDYRGWTRRIDWLECECPFLVRLKFYSEEKYTEATVSVAEAKKIWNRFLAGASPTEALAVE